MLPLSPHDPPVLGVHRLHARLGEDACTRVYLASAPGRPPSALKIVRSGYTSDPTFRGSFTHLVDSARGVSSRYVAPVVDADLRAATPWVAVDRPLGPTLAEVVDAHGPLPPAALHPLALAVAQGLADLHTTGHVHGSLWPDGVLLTRRHAVIADAGFESAVSEVDRRPPHPSFAAPEGGTTPATDVFAWAATLCFAASGVKGPAGLDQVPLQLRGLVEACLKARPVLRPDSVDLVHMLGGPASPEPWQDDLAALIDRYEAQARRFLPSNDAREERGRGRRKAPVLIAAGLSLLLVAGAGAAWGLSRFGAGAGTTAESGSGESALITDAGCLEGTGFTAPSGGIDLLDTMGVAFSPDGDLLAITDSEHGLTLWDWREGRVVAHPTETVYDRANPVFAPVGCTVSVLAETPYEREGGPYATLTTHDLPAGVSVEHPGPQSQQARDGLTRPQSGGGAAFSPSGDLMAVLVHSTFDSGLADLAIVDTATGEQVAEWGEDSNRGTEHLHFLDEDRIAAADHTSITVRDVHSGEEQQLVRDSGAPHFAVLPESNELVYVSDDHLIRWNHEERTESNRFPIPDFPQAWEDGAWITDLSVDTDLGLVHFSWSIDMPGTDGRLQEHHGYLFDLTDGTNLLADDDSPLPRPVAFHPTGEAIAAIQENGDVALLDPASLEAVRELP